MINLLDLKFSQIVFDLGRWLPQELVVFLGSWLFWFLAGYAGVIILLALRRRERLIIFRITAAAVLAFVVNLIIAYFYFRARPFVALEFSPVFVPLFLEQSFPSSHAGVSGALAGSFWFHNKKSGLAALGASALISLGRVLSGAHYLSDVLVGGFIGLTVAWIVAKINFNFRPIGRQQKQ